MMKLFVALTLFFFSQCATADYTLTFYVNSFSDPGGEDVGGECCDGKCIWGICTCPSACDFYFDFCIEPIHSGSTSLTYCTTYWKETPVIVANADAVRFSYNHQYGQWYNPISMNVQYGRVDGFYFKMRVRDEDDINSDDDVDWFTATFAYPAYLAGRTYQIVYNHPRSSAKTTQTSIMFTMQCAPGFHGSDCTQITTTTSTSSTTSTSATTSTTSASTTSTSASTTSTSATTTSTSTTSTSATTSTTSASTTTTTATTTSTTSTTSVSTTSTSATTTSTSATTSTTSASTSTTSATTTSTSASTTTTTTGIDCVILQDGPYPMGPCSQTYYFCLSGRRYIHSCPAGDVFQPSSQLCREVNKVPECNTVQRITL